MTTEQLIERDKKRLQANFDEMRRQSAMAGERLGVFARLRELQRERQRIAKRLIQRDPSLERAYGILTL